MPEVAAREHANAIFEVLENVLTWVNLKIEQFDYIAVTTNPWLMPSLLAWITFKQELCLKFYKNH